MKMELPEINDKLSSDFWSILSFIHNLNILKEFHNNKYLKKLKRIILEVEPFTGNFLEGDFSFEPFMILVAGCCKQSKLELLNLLLFSFPNNMKISVYVFNELVRNSNDTRVHDILLNHWAIFSVDELIH